MEGEGKYVFHEQVNRKHKFEGNYSNSYMSGFGTYSFPDGRTYRGEMRLDVMHGKGTLQWIEGYNYTGIWKYGYLVGYGTMKLPNNKDITGEFTRSNNLFSGSKCCSKHNNFSLRKELDDCFLLF
jgi:hypothetical protein